MRLQYEGNSYPRSGGWERTSQNVTRKNKGSKGMENTDESQGRRKFPRIRQFLPTFHSQLQPHSKTIERIKGQERMEMGKGTSRGIR